MKHTARQSPKFIRFMRLLRPLFSDCAVGVETIAVGLLERLWHATATGAIRGDIGRYDNELIAEMCGWNGDADQFIETLLTCGWLDSDPTHRLIIHDWDEHAPKFVKGNASKKGGIVTAEFHDDGPPPKAEPYGPPSRAGPKREGVPNLTQPNPTIPDGPLAVPSVRFGEVWGDAFPLANQFRELIDPGRKLLPKDRKLTAKAAVMAQIEGLHEPLLGLAESIARKDVRVEKPWAYFRSGIIRIVNERYGAGAFDKLWDSIELPVDLMKPPNGKAKP